LEFIAPGSADVTAIGRHDRLLGGPNKSSDRVYGGGSPGAPCAATLHVRNGRERLLLAQRDHTHERAFAYHGCEVMTVGEPLQISSGEPRAYRRRMENPPVEHTVEHHVV